MLISTFTNLHASRQATRSITLRWSDRIFYHCQGLKAIGITNDDGHFNIDPVARLHLFTSILNPPDVVLQTTTVCFQTAPEPAFGMSIIARTNRTVSFAASCDLATPDRLFRGRVSIPGNPRGICVNPEQTIP